MGVKEVQFKNEHGEVFYIKRDGVVVFSSSETGWVTLPLFNVNFDLWSNEELSKLGKALIEISEGAS